MVHVTFTSNSCKAKTTCQPQTVLHLPLILHLSVFLSLPFIPSVICIRRSFPDLHSRPATTWQVRALHVSSCSLFSLTYVSLKWWTPVTSDVFLAFFLSLTHTQMHTRRAPSCHGNQMIRSYDWMAEVEMYMCSDCHSVLQSHWFGLSRHRPAAVIIIPGWAEVIAANKIHS